jgi:hypothetical protein
MESAQGGKLPIRDAHPPNKVIDIVYILLLRLWCQENHRSPRFFALLNHTVSLELLNLLRNDFILAWPINWLTAACWCCIPSFNGKLKPQKWAAGAAFIETSKFA